MDAGGVGHFDGVHGVAAEVAVGDLDALGHGGGAGGVDNHSGVAVFDFGVEEVIGAGGHQVAVVLLAQRDIVFEGDVVLNRGAVVADRADEVLVAVGDEDQFGLDRVDHVGEFFALGAVVEGDEGDANLGAGVVDDHVFGGVDGHHADVVAAGEAETLEGVGEHGDVGGEFGEGLAVVFAEQGDAVGHVGGGDVEHVGGIHESAPWRSFGRAGENAVNDLTVYDAIGVRSARPGGWRPRSADRVRGGCCA